MSISLHRLILHFIIRAKLDPENYIVFVVCYFCLTFKNKRTTIEPQFQIGWFSFVQSVYLFDWQQPNSAIPSPKLIAIRTPEWHISANLCRYCLRLASNNCEIHPSTGLRDHFGLKYRLIVFAKLFFF